MTTELPPRKPEVLWESMTSLQVGEFAIRVWRQEGNLTVRDIQNQDLFGVSFDMDRNAKEWTDPVVIAESFLIIPRVNAVEVIDEDGDGIVAYKDWP